LFSQANRNDSENRDRMYVQLALDENASNKAVKIIVQNKFCDGSFPE